MTYVIAGLLVKEYDEPRPMVPLHVRHFGRDETWHDSSFLALVDSGSFTSVIPAEHLPPDVAWRDLTRTSGTGGVALSPGGAEIRLWHAELYVFGVRIASEVQVCEAGTSSPSYAILGLRDVFAHFRVGFMWGNVPPVFTMEPVAQALPLPDSTTVIEGIDGRTHVSTIEHPGLPSPLLAAGGPPIPAYLPRAARRAEERRLKRLQPS